MRLASVDSLDEEYALAGRLLPGDARATLLAPTWFFIAVHTYDTG